MDAFSISQLGAYADIKPHTIRAWEKRYNGLIPARSKGNVRFYDSCQVRRILNIVNLINAGYRPSQLCALPDDQLASIIESYYHTNGNETESYFISQLIAAGLTYDEPYFDLLLDRCLKKYKLKQAYVRVLLPLLNRIGLMWKCNKASVGHEHFISNILRRKLFSAVNSLPPPTPSSPTWLLFLPENEFHDIGLLFAYHLVRLSGQQAIYLGANVPLQALRSAVCQITPDNVFGFLVNGHHSQSLLSYVEDMDRNFDRTTIFIASDNCDQLATLSAGRRIRWLRTIEEFSLVLSGMM